MESSAFDFGSLVRIAQNLISETGTIWDGGGRAMYAIAGIGLVMFAVGLGVFVKLWRKGFLFVREETWRRWIHKPSERRGSLGGLIGRAREAKSLDQITSFFDRMHAEELAPFERDLKVMKVCVSAAPLVGLLGTVIGMLATFGALSGGSGGDKTMGMVAAGISEALITTETGLVVALPGLFLQSILARLFERYRAFLAHLQTVCTQSLYRDLQQDAARRVAAAHVARVLQQRLQDEAVTQTRPEADAQQDAGVAALTA